MIRCATGRFGLIAVLALLIGVAGRAEAGVVIDIEQVGSDVVATGSGTIDLAGLNKIGIVAGPALVLASSAAVIEGPAAGNQGDIYSGATGPSSFGPGGFTIASSGSGDVFGVNGVLANIYLPTGYV